LKLTFVLKKNKSGCQTGPIYWLLEDYNCIVNRTVGC